MYFVCMYVCVYACLTFGTKCRKVRCPSASVNTTWGCMWEWKCNCRHF